MRVREGRELLLHDTQDQRLQTAALVLWNIPTPRGQLGALLFSPSPDLVPALHGWLLQLTR
jgi:hypothetical protein